MLKIYTLDNSREWDIIVHSFKNYDSYYLSGYVKSLKIHGDGEPLLFFYKDDKIRGINVVMRRDIACNIHFKGKIEEGQWFDFSTPYGYGGWLIEGTDCSLLMENYEKWCKNNRIISEFVRFHPILENHESVSDSYEVLPLGYTVSLDLTSREIIWENIKSKNRNMIRKAQKNGIKIYNGRYPEIFEIFRKIYNQTMDKNKAEKYYYFEPEFYVNICENLSENVQVFYATLQEKVIAASIILFSNGRMSYHLSGSEGEYMSLAPTNLLLYEAALWGSENGCKSFHLGGGLGSEKDSLFEFKKAFYKGDLKRFYIGKKIINIEMYEKLLELRLMKKGMQTFFPEYRAANEKDRFGNT